MIKILAALAAIRVSVSSICLTALLVLTASALSQQAHGADNKSDCDGQVAQGVRHRLMEGGQLRPIFTSVDLLTLAMCDGMERGSTYDDISEALKSYVPETVEFSRGSTLPSWVGSADQACPDASDRGNCFVEVFRKRGYRPPAEVPFGKSGGLPFASFLGHAGDAGHYEITGKAVAASINKGMTWSANSKAILQDAARDADFYEWGNAAAHAQTKNDPNTGQIDEESRSSAAGEFIAWSTQLLRRAVELCREKKPRDALYLTGYSLHGIQDLIFHKGITNAEHSYRDFIKDAHLDDSKNPAYKDNMERAARVSERILFGFSQNLDKLVPTCWSQMISLEGVQKISKSDRERLLKKDGQDFGVRSYLEYKNLSMKVRDALDEGSASGKFFVNPRWIKPVEDDSVEYFINGILRGLND